MKTGKILECIKYAAMFAIAATSVASVTLGDASANMPISEVSPPNELFTPNHWAASDVFGYFFVKGKAPAGFTNIEYLLLGGEGEFGAAAKPPFYGDIHLTGKGKTDYPLLKPTLVGTSLSFQTEAVAGVSYRFEGKLSQTDFTENEPDGDAVVLSGTLTKMRKGKSLGHAKLKFTWSVGD